VLAVNPCCIDQAATDRTGAIRGLHHSPRGRHFNAVFHGALQVALLRDACLQIHNPVGQVVETVALSGNPGHFGTFIEQALVIPFMHHPMLATECLIQRRQ